MATPKQPPDTEIPPHISVPQREHRAFSSLRPLEMLRPILLAHLCAACCASFRLPGHKPRSQAAAAIPQICGAVLRASPYHKEVYVVHEDGHRRHERQLAELHRHAAVVLETFSRIDQAANRSPATCLEPPTARKYTLVVVFSATKNVLSDLLYDRATNPETVFLVLVDRVRANWLRPLIRRVWRSRYVFRVLLLLEDPAAEATAFQAVIFEPHAVCGRGAFRDASALDRAAVGAFLVRTLTSLRGCPLNIAMYEREPTSIRLNETTFSGQDGRLIDLLRQKMHFAPVIHLMEGKMVYGYKTVNGTTVGTFAELINGSSDVALNGHFLKDYKCKIVELTRQITSDRVCILTPKAGVIPPMITVFKSFQPEVWAMIAVTYLAVVFAFYAWVAATRRHRARPSLAGCVVALEVFRLMVASPLSRRIRGHSERILFAFCWFFSTVVLNSFQGSLVTFLNTPMYHPDLNTFDDLVRSGLPLRTASVSFRELLLSDRNLRQLDAKLYFSLNISAVENFHGRFAGFQRINVYNLKYFNDIRYVQEDNDTRLLHTMQQYLSSYFISYAIRKDSPYKRRINDLISGVERAGLVIKWYEDSAKYIFEKYRLVTKDPKRSKVFSVRDLEVAFFVCICGLATSAFVLGAEIGLHRRQTRRCAPRECVAGERTSGPRRTICNAGSARIRNERRPRRFAHLFLINSRERMRR